MLWNRFVETFAQTILLSLNIPTVPRHNQINLLLNGTSISEDTGVNISEDNNISNSNTCCHTSQTWIKLKNLVMASVTIKIKEISRLCHYCNIRSNLLRQIFHAFDETNKFLLPARVTE